MSEMSHVCKQRNEHMLHLIQCTAIAPLWRALLDFVTDLGVKEPEEPYRAILFGVWKADPPGDPLKAKMAPVWVLAALRLGWRCLYPAFT